MRIDLFLKTARLIKRRSIAREMCDSGRVLVNGREAKPGREVKRGDVITLKFSSRIIDFEVMSTPSEAPKKVPPEEMYHVTSDIRLPKEEAWRGNLS